MSRNASHRRAKYCRDCKKAAVEEHHRFAQMIRYPRHKTIYEQEAPDVKTAFRSYAYNHAERHARLRLGKGSPLPVYRTLHPAIQAAVHDMGRKNELWALFPKVFVHNYKLRKSEWDGDLDARKRIFITYPSKHIRGKSRQNDDKTTTERKAGQGTNGVPGRRARATRRSRNPFR